MHQENGGGCGGLCKCGAVPVAACGGPAEPPPAGKILRCVILPLLAAIGLVAALKAGGLDSEPAQLLILVVTTLLGSLLAARLVRQASPSTTSPVPD